MPDYAYKERTVSRIRTLSIYLLFMSIMLMENPQCLLLFGLVLLYHSCFLPFAISSSNFTDQSALLAIKSELSLDPANTVLGANWTTKASFCDWIGVSCSKRRQRVTALDLSFMGLHGTISPQMGNLSFLVSLQLQNNSFFGLLPPELGHLSRLRILALQENQLEGIIPPDLHHCQKLELINLTRNMFSGLIPESLGSLPILQRLYLTGNNLSGEIPSSLGNISTLQELFLDQNSLTGSFPPALLNLSSLVFIYLRSNGNLFGSFPVDFCHYWPYIQKINLSRNKFSGLFPSRISECRSLVLLSLSYNRFIGSIPEEIGSLQHLETLYLGGNSLTGNIPQTIGNMSNLKYFSMESNNIKGSIPSGLGRLPSLITVYLSGNNLTGVLPPEIFNMSTLNDIAGRDNALSGTFPSYTGGVWGLNLESIGFSTNQITGTIPSYFSNFSKLVYLDCSYNLLYGPIPTGLGNLKYLSFLVLGANKLTGVLGVPELGFLSSLLNSSSLETLVVSENPLNGIIPDIIGNFSSSLQQFYAQLCQIKGHIPTALGSLFGNLTVLALSGNNISGAIPSSVGGLENLRLLYLDNNNIEGLIPDELCHMRYLAELSLANNTIVGLIPNCIGNLSQLQRVLLNSNRLNSSIPINLWSLEDLLVLDLSFNSLNGYLPPGMPRSNVIEVIDLSSNRITGSIPSILGSFQSLSSLNLSHNLLVGSIPQAFGDLRGLDFLELSYNNLSGGIPKSLETLKFLKYLNFSFNQLSGEIPSGGPFTNLTAQSFLGNKALCGRPGFGVPPCRTVGTKRSKTAHRLLVYIILAVASTLILIALVFLCTKFKKRSANVPSLKELFMAPGHRVTSYHELRRATNDFSNGNLLGAGSYGSVYKAILYDGTTVAVKVLNMQTEGATKSFDAECKVWRAVRHRNLVKVITTCSSPDVRALVLQYMSNGSLEEWLYSPKYCLNLFQWVSIMLDIASALEYLHHGQSEAVVHCDLKPSNILLDEDMVGHVGDFGLAKIVSGNKDGTQTRTLGTIGYVAPEYGSAGKVSTRGDVYSYGIMMFEIIARKKPTDEMFSEDLTLRQWINVSLGDNVLEVVDNGLLSAEQQRDMRATKDIVLSIIEIGLRCSEQVPDERMDVRDVVCRLTKIKLALAK